MTTDVRETAGQDWLDNMRSRLTAELEARRSELAGLDADTSDPAEAHNQVALIANLQQSIQQINEALLRIEEGTYGTCEKCGNAIPRERLEILPYARLCVPCQQRHGR